MKLEEKNKIRRSKEKIRSDHAKFSICFKCDVPLRKTKQFRVKPTMCSDCRGEANSSDANIRKIQKEMKLKPMSQNELGDGSFFEDCPNAVKEYELEIGVKGYKPISPEVNFGVSPLSNIMSEAPSNYKRKIGSARDGVRYKRKDLTR